MPTYIRFHACAAATIFTAASIPFAAAQVQDSVVKRWLVGALDRTSPINETAADSSLMATRTPFHLREAWYLLKECRDDGKSLDLSLAAAEHYLFIRAFASEKGNRSVEALPGMYGSLKEYLGPAANLIKTSDQPVSPVDAAVVQWGKLGVAAGLADYKKLSGQQPTPAGAVEQLKLAVEGYYQNYTHSLAKPKCKVAL